MPAISFPKFQVGQKTKQLKKLDNLDDRFLQTTIESIISKTLTQKEKQVLLRSMLFNNLAGKNKAEIKDFCIDELKAICQIVDSHSDINAAFKKLADHFKLREGNQTRISNLLNLFTNRRSGCFGQQNINRSAAKYTQALNLILRMVSNTEPKVETNIKLVLNEANKCYRSNYLKNVSLSAKDNILTIKLGQENGQMGEDYKLDISLKEAISEQLISPSSEEQNDDEEKKSDSNYGGKSNGKIQHNQKTSQIREKLAQFNHIRFVENSFFDENISNKNLLNNYQEKIRIMKEPYSEHDNDITSQFLIEGSTNLRYKLYRSSRSNHIYALNMNTGAKFSVIGDYFLLDDSKNDKVIKDSRNFHSGGNAFIVQKPRNFIFANKYFTLNQDLDNEYPLDKKLCYIEKMRELGITSFNWILMKYSAKHFTKDHINKIVLPKLGADNSRIIKTGFGVMRFLDNSEDYASNPNKASNANILFFICDLLRLHLKVGLWHSDLASLGFKQIRNVMITDEGKLVAIDFSISEESTTGFDTVLKPDEYEKFFDENNFEFPKPLEELFTAIYLLTKDRGEGINNSLAELLREKFPQFKALVKRTDILLNNETKFMSDRKSDKEELEEIIKFFLGLKLN